LEQLPALIEARGAEILTLEAALSDHTLYARDRAKFEKAGAHLVQRKADLHRAEERWLELAGRHQYRVPAVEIRSRSKRHGPAQ
jgi:ATP-binding cassette subfamily F protein uup